MRLVKGVCSIRVNGGGAGNTGNGYLYHVIYSLSFPSTNEAIESTWYQYWYNQLICGD
jgi:hypothetical protein